MTVIKYKPRSYSHTRSTNSDTESFHITSNASSDVESITEEPVNAAPDTSPKYKFAIDSCIDSRQTKFGKRKQRRYNNRLFLETVKEEEDDIMATFTVMPFYKGPFTRLLEDEEALKIWNEFVQKPEGDQLDLLNESSDRFNKKCQQKTSILDPYWKISSKIRRTLRIKKKLSVDLVSSCENSIISFFKTDPLATYIASPPTSFQRLLIHGIAQYHSLNSVSFFVNGKSNVKVTNLVPEWNSSPVLLSTYIENLRSS